MKAAHTLPPEDVMAYLDGELNGDEARDIQAHLASCPECQRLSAELREGSMQLREWSVEDVRLTFVAPAPRQNPPRRDWFGLRVWTYLTRRPLIAGAFAWLVCCGAPFVTEVPAWRLLAGGFIAGFGARLSNGCTAGHGICGMASLQPASILAVLIFIATAMATARLVALAA